MTSRFVTAVLALGLLAAGSAPPVLAQRVPIVDWADAAQVDRAVFFFGGRFHSDYFGGSFNLFGAPYESNYVLGGGYQQFFQHWGHFKLGGEAGVALRFGQGEPSSGEVWAGVVGRYDGFVIGDTVRIAPAITVGLSAVSDTIGAETVRASWIGGAPAVLYYLGPELNFSLVDNPNVEAFWRIQHRSGGFGTIAHIDGSNASTVGVRWKF